MYAIIEVEIVAKSKKMLNKRIEGLKNWLAFCNKHKLGEEYEYKITKEVK